MTNASSEEARQSAAAARAMYDSLVSDPETLSALKREYRGRHDVTDALWWRAHPLTTSPRGTPDPAAILDSLARKAFSRGGGVATELELRRAEDDLANDAAHLDAVIERIHRHADAATPVTTATESTATGPSHSTVGHRRNWLLAAAGAVIIALAALSLSLWARLTATEASIGVDSASVTGAGAGDPFARFAREQRPADVPAAKLPDAYDPTSLRLLTTPIPAGSAEDYHLFGALTTDGRICLALEFDHATVASSCARRPEFETVGVEVSAIVYRQSTASLGSRMLVAHTVRWNPDDTLTFTSGSPNVAP